MWTLTRFALRKDRVRLTVWILAISCLPVAVASSFAGLYPDVASRVPFAADIEANSGLRALTGPAVDLTTLGGLTSWRAMGTTGIFTAIMNILLVLRHTRADEESGRLELLRSAPVSRAAPLDAALLTALLANIVLGLLISVTLATSGLPVGGSLGFGAAVAGCGLVFAGVAAVTAQLTEITRPATGIASATLAAAYLLRAAGDSTGATWLSWLSPLGWAQRLRPFGEVRWWTLLASLGASAALVLLAHRLQSRRDFGSGIVAARPGPPRAQGLGSSFALAWRLQRGALLGWAAGFAVLGAAVGALANSVGSLVDDSPQLADVLTALGGEQSVVDSYLGTVFGICGLVAGAYAVSALLRLGTEEGSGRAEMLLATPVGRLPWALGHLTVALAGPAALMVVAGIFTGATYGLVSGSWSAFGGSVLAAVSQVFAAWVFAGLGLLLFGVRPSAAAGAWALLGLAAALQMLGPVLDLPQAVLDLSPFAHLPTLPGGSVSVVPWGWLVLVTALLTGAGLAGLRRRDLG
ncbi:ABC transporter permease [Kineosporia succinea]|uniref:ABC-2 type transport system permease protein n=1 Tax=Kineosporia succinea TaxID=84632 RepID=A0ABT9P0U0_9ACTN|nr:ABC transporter permease [Kineosporia succinea]MDP9826297.1 ABC-2 type transport system permease protein [Kineosporia succinea]